MIYVDGIEYGNPESFAGTVEFVNNFCRLYSIAYPGSSASSTFAHIVLDDLNLEDSYIHWCLEWEQIRRWIDEEMGLINDDCGPLFTQVALRRQVLRKAADIIRFLNLLTTIPEEFRVEYVDD